MNELNVVDTLIQLFISPSLPFVFTLKDAVSAATDEERLIKIHDVIQQLPPPHYRSVQRHTAPLWQARQLPECRRGLVSYIHISRVSVDVKIKGFPTATLH